MGLAQDTAQCSRGHVTMFRNCGRESTFACCFRELHVASGLANFNKPGRVKFTSYVAVRDRPHAALTSISRERI